MRLDVSQQRTHNYIAQLKGSFFFKLLAVWASFLAIPIMVHYLGQERFGVWSTLLSIMSWILFFDLGIGNGLRNRLAEALAKNETEEAASYISSGYSLIGLLAMALFVILSIIVFMVPWQSVFNTDILSTTELRNVVLLIGFIIVSNFWLSLVNQVLNAVQKSAVVTFGQFLSNLLSLLGAYLLSKITDASLFYLATSYGLSLIFTNIVLSIYFFRQRPELMPCFSLGYRHVKSLLSLGGGFFVIQIAVVVIFTTDKMIIIQLFNPVFVTQYDIVFKLFGVVTIVHTIISAPLWSAYTHAFHSGDMAWIKNALYRQLQLFILIIVVTIGIALVAKPVIALWVGNEVNISISLVISMAAFVLVSTWNNIFSSLVNGIGKIKIQLFTAILGMLANIPLSIVFVKYMDMGVHGVVWATMICLLPFAFLAPLQVYFLSKKEIK